MHGFELLLGLGVGEAVGLGAGLDVVVTAACHALPNKRAAHSLSVNLIRTALESNPGDLHTILEKLGSSFAGYMPG